MVAIRDTYTQIFVRIIYTHTHERAHTAEQLWHTLLLEKQLAHNGGGQQQARQNPAK